MNVTINAEGRADCGGIDGQTTVQDLLDAVDQFLQAHPLPCQTCADSCCKKHWAVEVDNVAARRLAGEDARDFMRSRLKQKWNYALDFRQLVLKKHGPCPYVTEAGLCSVYEKRPVICRLYICCPRSERYDRLREVVAATYLQALVFERNMLHQDLSARTLAKYRQNPALGAADYSLPLADVIAYGQWMGWLEDTTHAEG